MADPTKNHPVRRFARASSWLWMLRKFGLRRTLWWWDAGSRNGWLTEADFDHWLEAHGYPPMVRNDGE